MAVLTSLFNDSNIAANSLQPLDDDDTKCQLSELRYANVVMDNINYVPESVEITTEGARAILKSLLFTAAKS